MTITTLRLSVTLLVAVALVQPPASGYLLTEPVAADVRTAPLATANTDIAGAGWFSTAVCIGCIAGALVTGGSSVGGLFLLVASRPGITAFCIGACLA